MTQNQDSEQISLTLPTAWLKKIDEMVNKHHYGAQNRQDIIRAILAPALTKED